MIFKWLSDACSYFGMIYIYINTQAMLTRALYLCVRYLNQSIVPTEPQTIIALLENLQQFSEVFIRLVRDQQFLLS